MSTAMTAKRALVIGITGSFGGALAHELLERGWKVRALVRDIDRARAQLGTPEGLEFLLGDALDKESMSTAAQGCDTLVYGFNIPYEKWDPIALQAAKILCEVALAQKLCVLFPGNIYGFGPDFEHPLAEDARQDAPTAKGRLRNTLESMLEEAAGQGAQVIIIRCGDYFGPTATAWFEQIVQKTKAGGPIRYPGPLDIPHEWAFLPDVARASIDLAERAGDMEAFEVFHFSGYHADGNALAEAIRSALGDPARPVKSFPWWLVRVAAPFARSLRELLEMRYLWEKPARLDDSKLRAFIGETRVSPLKEAVAKTLGIAP